MQTLNPETGTLEYKLELAYAKLLTAGNIPACTIYTGENVEDRILPAIVCKCHGGTEEVPGSNTWLEDVDVCVISNADPRADGIDPMAAHRRLVGAVKNILINTKLRGDGTEFLHDYLNLMVRGLTCGREIEHHGIEVDIRGHQIESTFKFRVSANENDYAGNLLGSMTGQDSGSGGVSENPFALLWQLPCNNSVEGGNCPCNLTEQNNGVLPGDPSILYNFTFRCCGIFETKGYTGGSNFQTPFFQQGGAFNGGDNDNTVLMTVAGVTYYLNKATGACPSGVTCYAIDYMFTIQAYGQSAALVYTNSVDGQEGANVNSLGVPNLGALGALVRQNNPAKLGQFMFCILQAVAIA
jgi:hypothetical protein